jgi:hypothetical protein
MFDRRSIPGKSGGNNYSAISADFGNMQDLLLPLVVLGAAYYLFKGKKEDPVTSFIGGGYSGGYAAGTGAAAVGAGAGAAVVGAIDGVTQVGSDLIASGINRALGTHTTGSAIVRNLETIGSDPILAPAKLVQNAADTYVQSVVDNKIKEVIDRGTYSSTLPAGTNLLSPKISDHGGNPVYVDLLKSKTGSTGQQLKALASVAVAESPTATAVKDTVATVSSNKYVSAVVKTEKAVLKTVLSGTGLTGSGTVKASSVVTAVKKVDSAVNKFVKVLNR